MTNENQPELIQRVSYRPSDAHRNRQGMPAWQQALAVVLIITLAALWFLFTAKSVVITFSPDAEAISIQGGMHLKLGRVFLMREGTYTVKASAQDHKPIQASLNVSDESNQTIQYAFLPTPGTSLTCHKTRRFLSTRSK